MGRATNTITRSAGRATRKTTRSVFRMLLATVFGAAFGSYWDRPGLVKPKSAEHPLERRAQVSSAIFWPFAACWSAVSLSPKVTVIASGIAAFVLMRRIMAAKNHGWPLRSMVKDTRQWLDLHPWLIGVLLVGCAALPLWFTNADSEDPRVHAVPILTLLAVAALIAVREAAWRTRVQRLLPDLAAAHNVRETAINPACLKRRKGGGFVMTPVPAPVKNDLSGAEMRMAIHMPEYEMEPKRSAKGVSAIEYLPAGAETINRRDILDQTLGMALAMSPTGSEHAARPDEHEVMLAPDLSPTAHAKFGAVMEGLGYQLVEWLPAKSRAFVARLTDDQVSVRTRLATVLRCEEQPHRVEVSITYAEDENLGRERFDVVTIHRIPARSASPDKRAETWRDLVRNLPDGSTGWKVEEDNTTGVVTLTYGQPRVLPNLVPMADLLPDRLTPQDWHRLPLGVGPEGQTASIDLTAGPHALVVGPTGSGKTIGLLQLAVAALTRGHRLVIVDPTKAGLDFLSVRPWCSAWADNLESAQATIEHIYAEVGRRKKILQANEAVKWSDLPSEVRARHDFHPTTVIIDEYGSLVMEQQIPKSLPKDAKFRIEAEQDNLSKAIIAGTVGRIAREARFAGIHLAIALQRPDAGIISGELRSNLTSAVQLASPAKPLSLDALRMVFPGEVGPQAAEVLAELDDGTSMGLAVVAAEGGSAAGFRVAYATPTEIPDLLRGLMVPEPQPWEVGRPRTAVEPEPVTGEIISAVAPNDAPIDVVDLGEIEFSLDALDNETGEDPFTDTTVTETGLQQTPVSEAAFDDFEDEFQTPARPTLAQEPEEVDDFPDPPKPKQPPRSFDWGD